MAAQERLMQAALRMADRGLGRVWPNPAVGCVIVQGDRIIARARTANGGRPHAETIALEQAGPQAEGATVYVTLEPCAHHGKTAPCVDSLIAAKVARVVIGAIDPDPRTAGKGIEALKAAGIEVCTGVLEKDCKTLNAGFFTRVTENRPYIGLKAACTKEGYMTPPEGRWITGPQALNLVHLQRRKFDAILVGIGTALADDPMLTTRLPGFHHSPVRIVLDSHLRLPADANLCKTAGIIPLWILYANDPNNRAAELESVGAKLIQTSPRDLTAVLRTLAEQGITRLLVEGGPAIHKAFMQAGLCDEISVYRSHKIAGGRGEALFSAEKLKIFARENGLTPSKTREIDQDSLEIYRRKV